MAFGVTTAATTAGADREPLTTDVAGLLITAIVLIFGVPLGLMLALLRSRWGWTAAIVVLTGLSIAAPVLVEAASDESSTAGLAVLIIPIYGTPFVVLLALAEAIVRRRLPP